MKVQTQRMPVLFLAHGSPMNAIETNSFTQMLQKLGEDLPQPRAILVVSAHWMTRGTSVTHMKNPKTIHDFQGFPEELFKIQYPAPGSPETAELIRDEVSNPVIHLDDTEWGLDHGTWSVLRHVYPLADIPVLQLSLDMEKSGEFHLALGKQLGFLRDHGVLIVGSGNIVHNLRRISWESDTAPPAWATEFDAWAKNKMEEQDFLALASEATSFEAGKTAIPTAEHYFPLLYVLGAARVDDKLRFDFEGFQNGSISMRCVRFG